VRQLATANLSPFFSSSRSSWLQPTSFTEVVVIIKPVFEKRWSAENRAKTRAVSVLGNVNLRFLFEGLRLHATTKARRSHCGRRHFPQESVHLLGPPLNDPSC